ncbi:MAG: hypothetical protein V4575_02860 [Pseudomonadota bacterium]
MDKINNALKQKCLSHLSKPIQVVVVGLLTTEEVFNLGLTPINGLDNLYKGSLTGQQILNLEKLDAIKSIEFDINMHVL